MEIVPVKQSRWIYTTTHYVYHGNVHTFCYSFCWCDLYSNTWNKDLLCSFFLVSHPMKPVLNPNIFLLDDPYDKCYTDCWQIHCEFVMQLRSLHVVSSSLQRQLENAILEMFVIVRGTEFLISKTTEFQVAFMASSIAGPLEAKIRR